jgi:hypothetical protein
VSEAVDYTKMRLGSWHGAEKIMQCPECGRKGVMRTYQDGSANVTHTGRIVGGLFLEVVEFCYLSSARREQVAS